MNVYIKVFGLKASARLIKKYYKSILQGIYILKKKKERGKNFFKIIINLILIRGFFWGIKKVF